MTIQDSGRNLGNLKYQKMANVTLQPFGDIFQISPFLFPNNISAVKMNLFNFFFITYKAIQAYWFYHYHCF